MIRGITLVLLFFFAAALAAPAQQAAPCLERTIPVSVASNDGSPTPELTAAVLKGMYDKKPVMVKSVEMEKIPPRVIFLVDTSGSMQGNGGLSADAAEDVLSQLPGNVEVGLALFSAELHPMLTPTKDHTRLIDQLDAVSRLSRFDKGHTALWAAVRDSLKMFGSPRLGDSIYLISDGADNSSNTNASEVGGFLASSGVRLFAFILEHPFGIRSRTPEELVGPDLFRGATRLSGGTTFFVPVPDQPYKYRIDLADKNGKPTQIAQGIQKQVGQMVGFYRVEITLPQGLKKPKSWKLDFASLDKLQQDRFELSYPTLLTPCGQS